MLNVKEIQIKVTKRYHHTLTGMAIISKTLTFVTTWMNLDPERQILYNLTFSGIQEQRVKWWLPGVGGERNGEMLVKGYKLSAIS